MLLLVFKTILRRRLRTALTITGIALAVAILAWIERLGALYKAELTAELQQSGIQLMLVPTGCPYDAAAKVLKGGPLDSSLPEDAVALARNDPAVEIAAPLLLAAITRPDQGRTDMFVGLDSAGMALKRWWHADFGTATFRSPDDVILGADAAVVEMRSPGDFLYSPETETRFKVAGVLKRSGTADDSRFFLPLQTAQRIFKSSGRVTAVAIRLRDPSMLRDVSERFREIPGVQVVTATEMMGTFLRILGAVKTLLRSVAMVALCASVLGLANTLLLSVAERNFEFSLYRALGASRGQIFALLAAESLILTLAGVAAGLVLPALAAPVLAPLLSGLLPFGQRQSPFLFSAKIAAYTTSLAMLAAIIVSLLPAWRAARNEPAAVLKGSE